MTNNTEKEVWTTLMDSKKPVCFVDSRPDFDAFGSALALKEILNDYNINLELYYEADIPNKISNYINTSDIDQNVDPNKFDFSKYDLLIMTDCGSEGHLKDDNTFTLPINIKILNIDHHETNSFYGEVNYVYPSAASVCLLLFEIFSKNNIQISERTADLLGMGIITDSGFFKYKSTSSKDLKAVASLMDKGFNLFQRTYDLTFEESLNSLLIKKVTLNNLVLNFDRKFAYSTINIDEINNLNLDLDEGLRPVDLIKTLEGVDFVFTIKQDIETPTLFHISFRSHKPDFDVSKYAKKLNGGGHKPAAGGTVDDVTNMEEAIQKVISVL